MKDYTDTLMETDDPGNVVIYGDAGKPPSRVGGRLHRQRCRWGALLCVAVVSGLVLLRYHNAPWRDLSTNVVVVHDGTISNSQAWVDTGRHGKFPRDATPIATAQRFLQLAEAEVAARGLDTCHDELGHKLVRDAVANKMVYCTDGDNAKTQDKEPVLRARSIRPGDPDAERVLAAASSAGSEITCMPLQVPWWPNPAFPCLSRGLRPFTRGPEADRVFIAPQCQVSNESREATVGATPPFVGDNLRFETPATCKELITHPVMFMKRQDQWNPFHVGEDLVMAYVSLLIAGAADPSLVTAPLQLAFIDDYDVGTNRWDALWGRMGAFAPRRTHIEPYRDGICLTSAIHALRGGESVWSAMGVGNSYTCASTLSWAGAYYFRHLYGYSAPVKPKRAINVLYISRENLRNYYRESGFGEKQRQRELHNEEEMVQRMRNGLREMCEAKGPDEPAELNCEFFDADEDPESWFNDSAETNQSSPIPLRFATMDPTGYAFENQIHLTAETTVMVAQHGGAMGLSFFLPPGHASLLELVVPYHYPDLHYEHMAGAMGHEFDRQVIVQQVDVNEVWESLRHSVLVQADKPHRRASTSMMWK